MNIGLVGEDPLDTISLKNLLSQKFDYRFMTILKNIRGCQLDSGKTKRLLNIELQSKNFDAIVFIRDLDDFGSNSKKIQKLDEWYNSLKSICKTETLFLLNIFEIEALIVADINSFNKIFSTSLSYPKNPTLLQNPKEFLISKTRKVKRPYRESDNPEIFSKLDIETIQGNCIFFDNFINEFSTLKPAKTAKHKKKK